MPKLSQLFSSNAVFLDRLYQDYLNDPSSVDKDWQEFFADLESSYEEITSGHNSHQNPSKSEQEENIAIGQTTQKAIEEAALESVRALMLIRTYRVRGHLNADLDPLGLSEQETHHELSPAHHGFHHHDYDKPIFLNGVLGLERASLKQIITTLMQTYCGKVGTEFMHIQYPDQKSWIQEKIEEGQPKLSNEEKTAILENLIEVEAFEKFLNSKFPGTKWFSLLGSDSVIPGLEAIINRSSDLGVDEVVIGMPHRGRMNVLTAVMKKPYLEMMALFHGHQSHPAWIDSSGDVKYHLGMSSDRKLANGKNIHLSLNSNPSHLEAVNPVVVGKVRAKQKQCLDEEHERVMALFLHGDASFAGQGVVSETLALSELRGYKTGGSVHVIVNNQIGFTTAPKHSRSSPYSSDLAKAVQAPIFHVNGDDPEAVVYVCKLASEFRQKFKRDAVVDVFCYRKFGHNEGDEPMFTQPIMYKEIKNHPLPAKIYADRLINEGVLTQEEVDEKYRSFKKHFEEAFKGVDDYEMKKSEWFGGKWKEFSNGDKKQKAATGVKREELEKVGYAISKIPDEITINKKLERLLNNKRKMIETGEDIDWATAEALAFGTLLAEGHPVRLSGQDSRRGTFSQRHSVLIDQENEDEYIPLNHISDEQSCFEVINSNLSEFAVLGFEYGYSTAEPNGLIMWEAQFGDFANGAQVIIDQFISSAEIKWLRMNGLVMLLPHGYDGQGPEHSSARLERYLQLCAEDNMQVANCTTPANYFHILRRQLKRKFRKPLILMTPKSLLRHKFAISNLDDFTEGTEFKRVIGDNEEIKNAKRVILCSGKVFYDLYEWRMRKDINYDAIIRVEQLYPFPEEEIKEELAKYGDAELVWCQEEPKNMGAWSFISPLLEELAGKKIRYAGRKASASPATGYLEVHQQEQQQLIEEALS